MNTSTGSVLDDAVLEWLDGDLLSHTADSVVQSVANIVYTRRITPRTGQHITDIEDVAALSHDELSTILTHTIPDHKYDLSLLSNLDILGLTMNALSVVNYSLPAVSSPMLEPRVFANKDKLSLGGFSTRSDIAGALHSWEFGLSDLDLSSVIDGYMHPEDEGMYLCYDEHRQVRYGSLFKNALDGWTFCERHAGGSSTSWVEANCKDMQETDLSLSLLSHWVFIAPVLSPTVRKPATSVVGMTDTQRIFMYLRSLSPYVKAEFVTHFAGILEGVSLPSVESIGRLSPSDWRKVADAVADNSDAVNGKWEETSVWDCFTSVLSSLMFNMETKQFDPRFDFEGE